MKRQRMAKARGNSLKGSMAGMGVDKENSLRTVHWIREVLYTNTGWSVHNLRAGIFPVSGWGQACALFRVGNGTEGG